MKESTGYYIIFGAFGVLITSMVGFQQYEGQAFLKDCTQKQIVKSVEACESGRRYLNCTVKTDAGVFRTDLTEWPGSMLYAGDGIYTCSIATRLRDIPRVAHCKNGSCYY